MGGRARAASGVHVQSIDDNTFRSDTPACTREERRVVGVGGGCTQRTRAHTAWFRREGGGEGLPGAVRHRADLDAPVREGLLDARRPFSRATVQLLAPSPQLLVQLARLVQDTPQRLASSRGAQTLDRVLVRLPSLRLSARRCHALVKLALGCELLPQLRPQLLKLSVEAALIRPVHWSVCDLGWHTEDIVQRIQLELVEVLVRRALHLQLPPVETLRRGQKPGVEGWQRRWCGSGKGD